MTLKTVPIYPKEYTLKAFACICPHCLEEQLIVIPGYCTCVDCGEEFFADDLESEEGGNVD